MALTLDEYKQIKRRAEKHWLPHYFYSRPSITECKLIGWGSDRTTYAIQTEDYEPVAFKVSDPGKTLQTEIEIEIYKRFSKRYPQYIPRVFDWSPTARWIEVEILRNVTKAQIFAQHGFTPTNAKISTKMAELPAPLRDFAKDTGLLAVEMDRVSHWGRSSDGRIKLRDFGTLDT